MLVFISFYLDRNCFSGRSCYSRVFPFSAPFQTDGRRDDVLAWILTHPQSHRRAGALTCSVSPQVLMGQGLTTDRDVWVRLHGPVRLVPTHYCIDQGALTTRLKDFIWDAATGQCVVTYVGEGTPYTRPTSCPISECKSRAGGRTNFCTNTSPGMGGATTGGPGHPYTCRDQGSYVGKGCTQSGRVQGCGSPTTSHWVCKSCKGDTEDGPHGGYKSSYPNHKWCACAKDTRTMCCLHCQYEDPPVRPSVSVSHLTTWCLQAATDESQEWVTLKRHDNDTSIRDNGGVGHWSIDLEEPRGFNKFRVVTEAVTSAGGGGGGGGQAVCILQGLELYGTLTVTTDNFSYEFFKPPV